MTVGREGGLGLEMREGFGGNGGRARNSERRWGWVPVICCCTRRRWWRWRRIGLGKAPTGMRVPKVLSPGNDVVPSCPAVVCSACVRQTRPAVAAAAGGVLVVCWCWCCCYRWWCYRCSLSRLTSSSSLLSLKTIVYAVRSESPTAVARV